MPFIPNTTYVTTSATGTSANADTHEQLEKEREAARPGFMGALLGSTVLAVPDFIDQTISSIPFIGPERGAINDRFFSAIGSPTLNRFANEQQGATELISGIAGIYAADRIAGRVFRPGSMVMSGIRQMPGVRNIAALDKQYELALRASTMGMREAATRGEMGANAFSSVMTYRSLGVKTTLDLGRARRNVDLISTSRGAGRALGTEIVMAGMMNTNSIFFSDDLTENLANAAIGIGVGGFLGHIQGSWALRKAAGTSAREAEAIQAYDPRGHERARKSVASLDDVLHRDFLGFDHEMETSVITSQMLHAKESRLATANTERGQTLFRNRTDFANELQKHAFQSLNKVTGSGVHGVTGTGFNDSGNAYKALTEGLEREPTLLYGAAEVGVANEAIGVWGTASSRKLALESRIDALGKIIRQGGLEKLDDQGQQIIEPLSSAQRIEIQNNLKKLWYDNSKQGFVQLIPGELAPLEFGRIVDGMQKRRVVSETSAGKTVWQAEKLDAADSVIGVGDDLMIYTPGNKAVSQMSTQDVIQLYRVARQATDRLAVGPKVVVLPEKPNWFQLDMAERILKISDNPAKVTFPKGMSREDAIVESLAQKVDVIRGSKGQPGASEQKVLGFGGYKRNRPPANDIDAFAARIKYNLPQFTPAQSALYRTHETPIDQMLYGFKDGDEVRKIGYERLKEIFKQAGEIQGLTDDVMRSMDEMSGKSYDFLLGRDGKELDPVLIYKRPMVADDWNREALDSSIALRKAYQRGLMIGDSADPITRELVNVILNDSNFAQALKVGELSDNQQFSWIPGLVNKAPQSNFGALTDALNVAGREFRDRDILTMTSASRTKDLQDRVTRELMSRVVKDTMGDIMTRIAAPRAGQSRIMLNHFFAQRQGWDLLEEVVESALPGGGRGYKFQLDDTAKNRQRFEVQFQRPMKNLKEEGPEFLPNSQGVEIILDDLAFEGLSRFNQLSEHRRNMQNTLLRSQGLQQIQKIAWWVPSPETKGKFIAFTFDANGNVVPGMGIVANTPDQLTKLERDLMSSPRWQNGYVIRRRDTVTSFLDLWDKAQMDWHDPSVTVVQSGKVNRGRLTAEQIDLKAWDRANAQMIDGFIEHGSDTLNLLTKDSVLDAKIRAEIGRTETAAGRSDRQLRHSGIYDRYIQNISGRYASSDRQGMVSPIFNAVEDRINSFFQSATPTSSQTYQMAADWFRQIPFLNRGMQENNKVLFEKLRDNLGPYMPFDSVAQFMEAQTGHALPREVKEISAKISWMEATSKLRWLESVHAVMNFGSMIHNLPAITKGLQRLKNESDEDWAKRIGHVGTIFGEQHKAAVVNPGKLLFLAFKDARKPSFDEFTKKAFARGFMNQEVAELERQFSSIKTPGAMRAFLFGDAKADPSTLSGRIAKKGGLDYWLGYMSDKSEDYTRRVSMYFGRRLAQMHGIENVDDQVAFAHDVANKTIANYDPRNRPEIFQGWLGAPIGLFQSYVTNYYARMFRLFETHNMDALRSQALWQSSVFGVKSFGPFWNQANSMFFDRGQVLEDSDESFEHRLGTAEADLLLYGTLSNMPKIFGADGTSVYTRGDINVRLPVVNMPIADTVKRIWNGTSQMVDAVANNTEGLTGQQLAEILSNTLGNRPMAGMIETFGAGGYDTDKNGQVVLHNENLWSMNTAYRMMGIRGLQQQKSIEAFYQDKEAKEGLAALQTTLRLETRANIRAGNLDALPNLFVKYVENGGDRRYFTQWYKNAMESALETRSERELDKLMKNGKKMASVNRLLDAGVTPSMDADSDDYGAEDEQKQRIAAEVDEMLSVQESPYDLR